MATPPDPQWCDWSSCLWWKRRHLGLSDLGVSTKGLIFPSSQVSCKKKNWQSYLPVGDKIAQ
eukprot:655164-Ditylum_brightwellii.AAC.1